MASRFSLEDVSSQKLIYIGAAILIILCCIGFGICIYYQVNKQQPHDPINTSSNIENKRINDIAIEEKSKTETKVDIVDTIENMSIFKKTGCLKCKKRGIIGVDGEYYKHNMCK